MSQSVRRGASSDGHAALSGGVAAFPRSIAMFTALTLTLALGAPVPAGQPAPPAGTAPRLVELTPDAKGKIIVTITRTEMMKVPVPGVIGAPPGGNAPPPAAREVPVTKTMVVELGEVKDLAITTADGKKLEKEEGLK